MARAFRALEVRNYRLYFCGQGVSLTGTWMQNVAQGWLVVHTLGRSGSDLGLVYALNYAPLLLGGQFGGLIADRYDKRKLMIMTQLALASCASALAAVTISGVVTLPMVMVIAFVTGIVALVDTPLRHSLVGEIAGPEHVANAVSVNAIMFNSARVIGPGIGAVVISLVGVGMCFALNAVSFVAAISALSMMRTSEMYQAVKASRARGQIREGLRYVWATREIRMVVLMLALVGTLTMNFQVLLPLMARDELGGADSTLGVLSMAMGFGSIAGALVLARRARPTPRLLVGAAIAFSAALGFFAWTPTLMLAVVALVLTGAVSITFMNTANATLQQVSTPEMRGRVMALYAQLVLGSTPIGAPLVGWVSDNHGARSGVLVGSVAVLLAAGVGAWTIRPRLRGASSRPNRVPNFEL